MRFGGLCKSWRQKEHSFHNDCHMHKHIIYVSVCSSACYLFLRLDEVEYNVFTCNDDGTVTFGELCDETCGDCELGMENQPDGLCFVNEETVHVVDCAGDATVRVYMDGDLDCESDLTDEDFEAHVHVSGECVVDIHDHDHSGNC